MDGRPAWTDFDEANALSPRDLVFRPDNMDETVPHRSAVSFTNKMLFIRRRIWQGLTVMSYIFDVSSNSVMQQQHAKMRAEIN